MKTTKLRGNRFRKARRQIKRGQSNEHVTFMDAEQFDELVATLDIPDEIASVSTVIKLEPYKCTVCGASGDDPCVTKTGNKAKSRHAGRDVM